MPSPFPGMDPYLEGSEWTSFHALFGSEIVRQLAPKIRPKYMVRPLLRFVMNLPEDVVKVTQDKIPVFSVEIRDTAERGLVTAIEIVSPITKQGMCYKKYLAKRRRILHHCTHLLEIALLRQGKQPPISEPLLDAPYFVFLSRAEKRPVVDVWPIQLDMRLPIVPIPLLDEDEDVVLDLQLIFDSVYETYRYDLAIDYSQPPDVPLEGKWAGWAAERVQAADLATDGETE